jgi:hypothetical protein
MKIGRFEKRNVKRYRTGKEEERDDDDDKIRFQSRLLG